MQTNNIDNVFNMHKRIWKWKPFTYVCEGFDNNTEEVGGVFPKDVRQSCSFTVKQIHGPIVVGFWSWCMNQLVNY